MGESILVRCSGCGTLNRVPAEKAGESGRCGSCGAALVAQPVDVTDSDFDSMVRRARLPVLVEFWSPSCGHCVRMNPVMEGLARELAGRALVAKVNVNSSPNTSYLFEIRATPAFVVMKDGTEKARVMGAVPKDELVRLLAPYL